MWVHPRLRRERQRLRFDPAVRSSSATSTPMSYLHPGLALGGFLRVVGQGRVCRNRRNVGRVCANVGYPFGREQFRPFWRCPARPPRGHGFHSSTIVGGRCDGLRGAQEHEDHPVRSDGITRRSFFILKSRLIHARVPVHVTTSTRLKTEGRSLQPQFPHSKFYVPGNYSRLPRTGWWRVILEPRCLNRCFWCQFVESRMGASTDAGAPPRFPSPLIKPDVPN
jgi:hypothetical protein